VADCTEGFAKGNFTDKAVNYVFPLYAPAPFPVYCWHPYNMERTYVMFRMAGNVTFNRNWTEYVHGFGDLTGDHFIGLQQVQFSSIQFNSIQIQSFYVCLFF
jgi:hypothetical protein